MENTELKPVDVATRLKHLTQQKREIEKVLKQVEEHIEAHKEELLRMLDAAGAKHFSFENLGTFTKSTREYVSFPLIEKGGREAAKMFLDFALNAGIITPTDILDLQQARLNVEQVASLEEQVMSYCVKSGLAPMASPFHHYEKVSLLIK